MKLLSVICRTPNLADIAGGFFGKDSEMSVHLIVRLASEEDLAHRSFFCQRRRLA